MITRSTFDRYIKLAKAGFSLVLFLVNTFAYSLSVQMFSSTGTPLGSIYFENTKYGLLITPKLTKLPVGLHGFHIHQHPSCDDKGMSAGGHFDPANTLHHLGPYGEGHLGDSPLLAVNSGGEANTPILAPRLQVDTLIGHAIMIHEGGDNYSDTPPLGGGGTRIGCGKIPLN